MGLEPGPHEPPHSALFSGPPPTGLFLQQPLIFVPHDAGHVRPGHWAPHLQGVAHVHQEISQVLREPWSFQGWGQESRGS